MESLKGYWRRRKYRRLDGSRRGRKKNLQVQLGEKRRNRFWRIKIKPRLRWFRFSSPKTLLIKLRDAYVRMMLSFANSPAFSVGDGMGSAGFGRPPLKEYDEKMILEIYKTLMLQQQQMGSRRGGEIVLRR